MSLALRSRAMLCEGEADAGPSTHPKCKRHCYSQIDISLLHLHRWLANDYSLDSLDSWFKESPGAAGLSSLYRNLLLWVTL